MQLLSVVGVIIAGFMVMLVMNPASNLRLWFLADSTEAVALGDYCFNADKQGTYDLDCATRAYTYALSLDPTALYAWHQLARIDFLRGNFTTALQKIDTQITLHGDALPGAYYVRGLIYGFRGELLPAEADFRHYLSFHPGSWGAHNDLAWIYFQQGEYQKAGAAARAGLAYAPENPWLLTSLGVSLMNAGERDEAKATLRAAYHAALTLTPSQWSNSNPGNDPAIAKAGVAAMIAIIERNLALVD